MPSSRRASDWSRSISLAGTGVTCAVDGSGTTSAVVAPDGSVVAWQPYGKEGLLVVDIDLTKATGLLASRCRTP